MLALETVRSWTDQILATSDGKKQHTFSCIVAGIIEGRTSVPADIGRNIPTDAFEKHKIKQVDRYLNSKTFDAREISRGLLTLVSPNLRPQQRVAIALDWTATGNFETLTSSIVMGGRALPFHWTVIDQDVTRMAVAERQHLKELRKILPNGPNFVLLFDAGFDDASFIRFLDKDVKLQFVVRTGPSVSVQRCDKKKFIHLMKCCWKRGVVYDWGDVLFSQKKRTQIRFVAIHDHGMADPWLLLTNLKDPATRIVQLYGRRFETEETYKDLKDIRSGLQLKGTRVESVESLERLIAACAAAYFVLILAGLYGEEIGHHRRLQANSTKHRRVLALWRVGRSVLRRGIVASKGLLSRLWLTLQIVSIALGGPSPIFSGG